jgi:16S rRNA (cytidine1402-2'-O)-methyltransferase
MALASAKQSWKAGDQPGEREPSGLYVVASPIGNARDITLRALDVLKSCDLIAAEDTRVTAKLLAIHGISKPLAAYNDHNAARERPRLLRRLREGARVALISDAGTPLISDPGYKLVREAIAEGIAVHAVPGASAVLTALTLAALPTDRFLFAGFLPSRTGERQKALDGLRSIPATLVFFESPHRVAESVAAMHEVFGNRPAAVARELTKLHEEVFRGDLQSIADEFARRAQVKGEVTIVVGASEETGLDLAPAEAFLREAMPYMPLSAAADLIARALDLPRRMVYERALALKSGNEEG